MSTGATDPRRSVPRTDAVLGDPRLSDPLLRLGPRLVKGAVTSQLRRVRAGELAPDQIVPAVLDSLPRNASSLVPVVNATGVLLHPNLGRAALSAAAVEAVVAAAGVTDVEFDLATGSRARRGRGALAALANAVPAAGDVHVVNNGASALVLAATALASGREIVVSRGEMVEIGDGFRLPDLLESTGARLREVGTTNRTTLADYTGALGASTGMVLKVHPSNFVVRGFTSSVSIAELAPALSGQGVPLVADLGSGLLAPHRLLPDEPDAATALASGADLVTGSGDKLLGGPQAGLLLGRADLVALLRRHPLARALRVDKLTLAALEATLRGPDAPVVAGLEVAPDLLRGRAEALAKRLGDSGVEAAVVPSDAAVGGGGAPEQRFASWALSLPAQWAGPLRQGTPSVVGRVEHGALLVDLRSVQPEQDALVLAALLALPRA
jgi:L-seryl-tRNA(Ser) seleniumtransferase